MLFTFHFTSYFSGKVTGLFQTAIFIGHTKGLNNIFFILIFEIILLELFFSFNFYYHTCFYFANANIKGFPVIDIYFLFLFFSFPKTIKLIEENKLIKEVEDQTAIYPLRRTKKMTSTKITQSFAFLY